MRLISWLLSLSSNFLLIIALSAYACSIGAREASEQDIKAVYLYNFLRFVKWPEPNDNQEVAICIMGQDSYQDSFRKVEGRPLKSDQRTLVIHRLNSLAQLQPDLCQILFITASEQAHYREIITTLKHSAVLSISEIPGFIDAGGMVEFHRVGNKIRWKINLTPVTNTGFKIDRRLLNSATEVIGSSLP